MKNSHPASRKKEQGIVLLVVLWTLVLLSLMVLNIASSMQTETMMARTAQDSEQAYYFARGALEETMYWLAFPDRDEEKQKARLPYYGGMNHYWIRKGDFYSHVAILDEGGKLDLNFCDPQVMQKLLQVLGNEESTSAALAASIAEWRKPDLAGRKGDSEDYSDLGPSVQYIKHRAFDSIEELMLVPGMTREILYGSSSRVGSGGNEDSGQSRTVKGLADYVTVFVGKNQINPNYAEPEVLASLPGLDMTDAIAIVNARQSEPYKSAAEIGERTALLLQGEAQSKLSTQLSQVYSLIASSSMKNSQVRRSLRVVVKNSVSDKRMERLIWQDEYWASQRILAWLMPVGGGSLPR